MTLGLNKKLTRAGSNSSLGSAPPEHFPVKGNAACTEAAVLLSIFEQIGVLSFTLRHQESLWPADLEGIIVGDDDDDDYDKCHNFPSVC